MKKYCIILFVLLLALGLCFAAGAEEAEPTVYQSGDYEYILLADGTAQITDYIGNATELIVPDTLDGYPVTSIRGDAFFMSSSLTAITLPEGITSIGEGAFAYCRSLTAITLPDSVTEIGVNSFAYCEKLTTIQVSPDHPVFATIDGVLFNKTEKKLVCYPGGFTATEYQVPKGIRSIGDHAFSYCRNLTAIILADSVTSIGEGAFYGCSDLTAITLPEGLTIIGDESFYGCSSLAAITLPEGLTIIGDFAFCECSNLTAIILPDSTTEMGVNPFACCEKLTNIQVSPDHPIFATIDGVLFNKTEKKLVCYPGGFTATEYQVPKGIRSIGDNAFFFCCNLTAITVPDSVTSIGVGAFASCYNLTAVTLPEGLASIGDGVFAYCRSLNAITLPESLESIGTDAFARCPEYMQFTVVRDSYAARWCKENGVNYTYTDALDWLNE